MRQWEKWGPWRPWARPGLPIRALARVLTVSLVAIAASTAWSTARAAELVMFELQGCPWCKMWHAEIGPGYPKSPEGQRAPLRIVDIKAPLPHGLVLDKPVTSSPTFVLVDNDQEVGRITGYPGADFFWVLLDELLAKLAPGSDSPTSPPGEEPRSL